MFFILRLLGRGAYCGIGTPVQETGRIKCEWAERASIPNSIAHSIAYRLRYNQLYDLWFILGSVYALK